LAVVSLMRRCLLISHKLKRRNLFHSLELPLLFDCRFTHESMTKRRYFTIFLNGCGMLAVYYDRLMMAYFVVIDLIAGKKKRMTRPPASYFLAVGCYKLSSIN